MSIVTYHSPPMDAGSRGYRFGRDLAGMVQSTVSTYRGIFAGRCGLTTTEIAGFGEEVGSRLQRDWPDAVEEIDGIARGAGVPVAELLAVNARTELLGQQAGAECTVVGAIGPACGRRDVLMAQTWDFVAALEQVKVFWIVEKGPGDWFATMTEAGQLAKIGLNSSRLACMINLLRTTSDGSSDGIPVHILCRLVLEQGKTLSDALLMLINTPAGGSTAFTLGYADQSDGALVTVERGPAGVELLWPSQEGVLVHANHFLRKPASGRDVLREQAPSSLVRQWWAERALKEHDSVKLDDLNEALRSHFGFPTSVCSHGLQGLEWWYRTRTLAAISIDVAGCRAWVSSGNPCETPFEEMPLPPARELQSSC